MITKTRFFDILFSAIGLIVLLPLLLVIAILIKINSKGPAIFKQQRVGKNNKDFTIYKFRTMFIHNATSQLLTIGSNDKRITGIGFYLRKYQIDELPQLLNVLTGQMSFVGPRPEVRKYVNLYTDEQKKILLVTPGITDWASLKYTQENDLLASAKNPEQFYIEEIMPAKILLNQRYIQSKNLRSYFAIIFRTIFGITR